MIFPKDWPNKSDVPDFFKVCGIQSIFNSAAIVEYEKEAQETAEELYWHRLRGPLPFGVYWAVDNMYAPFVGMIAGALFCLTPVWVLGLVMLIIGLRYQLWASAFRVKNSPPVWRRNPAGDFLDERPQTINELMYNTISFAEREYIQLLVESHPLNSTRFLLIRDCRNGKEYYVESWSVFRQAVISDSEVVYAPH